MAKKPDKTILLVAVDFSPFSEEALFFASKLAEKLKAQLLVLHVIHDPAEAPGFYARQRKKKKFLQTMEEAAEEMMQEFLKKMRQAYPDQVPIKKAIPLLIKGTPVKRIVEIAEKRPVKPASLLPNATAHRPLTPLTTPPRILFRPRRAGVAEWQTRRTQNPLSARTWGFDSPLRHQVLNSCKTAS